MIIISFCVTLILVLILSRLVNFWLEQLLGSRWFKIICWPGVVVHELSHLLGAVLTLTKVTGFSLLPRSIGSAGQVLGSVTHEASKNPLTLILISLFPFLGGSFILWCLAIILIPNAPLLAPVINISSNISQSSLSYLSSWWSFIIYFWQILDFSVWQTWLFLYLAFGISAHLAPSTPDLKHTSASFTAISLLVILLVYGSQFLGKPIGGLLLSWSVSAITFFAPLLSYSLAMLLLVVMIVGISLGIKRLNHTVVWWG